MTAVQLSSRQRAILEAMAAGATLRWGWVPGPSFGTWRYLLDGKVIDGRPACGLVQRGLVQWDELRRHTDVGLSWELSDAGRRAVQPDGGGS